MQSMNDYSDKVEHLKQEIEKTDVVLIGAGAGLSASAGYDYSGKRFEEHFSDFIERYGIHDMYSAGFYPYESLEEYWAFWSRHIYLNRYQDIPKPVYKILLELVEEKDYFVLTTNVDHCFQRAGFDKQRLFYTQGDMGLWQCSVPCHQKTYDNKAIVEKMIHEQKNMRVPSGLVPHCPLCGAPMTMNLRIDHTFVEDAGWHEAKKRYERFLSQHTKGKILFLELGVGGNTPGIIKYPFWKMTYENPHAVYVTINQEDNYISAEIEKHSIGLKEDIGKVLEELIA